MLIIYLWGVCVSPQNVNMYGVGNAAAQGRNAQQPPAQSLNSAQPSLRNQVPPPLLPSQVTPLGFLKLSSLCGIQVSHSPELPGNFQCDST